MYAFIALIANSKDPRSADIARCLGERLLERAPQWRAVLRSQSLSVFQSGERAGASQAYLLAGGCGAVLGTLFTRHRSEHEVPTSVSLGGDRARAIIASGARQLVSEYWGRYVAFMQDSASDRTYVLRDPMGGMPCFFTSHLGVHVFFSRPGDCALLGLPRLEINWHFIAMHMLYRGAQTPDTGLAGVCEVQPGECISICDGQVRHALYWEPLRIAPSDIIENIDDAARLVYSTARTCVQAWASCYGGILHTLSGGLDSSIVLSCLRDAPTRPRITALNYVTQGAEGDERCFAREAARSAGCELIEHERRPEAVRLQPVLGIALSAKPSSYRYHLEHSRFEADLAHERNASAVFGGGGGDQLFYRMFPIYAVVDYLRQRGISAGLIRAAWSTARIQDRSIWSVLNEAITYTASHRRWAPASQFRRYRTLLPDGPSESQVSDDQFLPRSLRVSKGMPHGKLWHALLLSTPPFFYDPLGEPDDPERVHPLMSQPLVELCLRIPTYVLSSGGWDGMVARRAFADDVPRLIVARRTKGHIDDHGRRMLQANMPFVRELLLDGMLVRERLLDRVKLERVLSKQERERVGDYSEVADHLSTEAWLRRWTDAAAPMPA